MKICSFCKEEKEISEFHKDSSSKDGSTYYCKDCAIFKSRKHHRERILNDPQYKRAKRSGWVKRAHGITLDQYEDKLAQQNSVCAICEVELFASGPLTHLDHCHKTGKLRAFLCTNCNRGLGQFKDNPTIIQNAIDYLNAHNSYVEAKEGVKINESSH